ncbi:unnamed protein product [Allacma fusca]|uniref:Uncharacterized protein n=1 Tax=Allacma fusca TaxID=39272 RepID=A0A8J2L029_9HEXA|nr:unnamed protein product [Allacma fusca]
MRKLVLDMNPTLMTEGIYPYKYSSTTCTGALSRQNLYKELIFSDEIISTRNLRREFMNVLNYLLRGFSWVSSSVNTIYVQRY